MSRMAQKSENTVNVEYHHYYEYYRYACLIFFSVLFFNGHGHGGRHQTCAAAAAADVGARRSRRGGGRLRLLKFLLVNFSLFGASVLKPNFHLKHKTRGTRICMKDAGCS